MKATLAVLVSTLAFAAASCQSRVQVDAPQEISELPASPSLLPPSEEDYEGALAGLDIQWQISRIWDDLSQKTQSCGPVSLSS